MKDIQKLSVLDNSFVNIMLIVVSLCLFVSPWTSVHGISQASTLEWITISFSRGSSQPRD